MKAAGLQNTPKSSATGMPVLELKAAIRLAANDRSTSNFGALCQEQRILHVDAKIAHRVLDFGVTE